SATGQYAVRLVVPAGYTQDSANPSTILVSRGGLNTTGVNFHITQNSSSSGGPATWHGDSGGGNSGSGTRQSSLVDEGDTASPDNLDYVSMARALHRLRN